jgi:glucose/arabinose dehydrogenase
MMRSTKTASAIWIMLAAVLSVPAQAQLAQAVLVDASLDDPIYATGAPGTPNLLFVVEKGGVIQVFQNEVKQSAPFLDIETLVSSDGERGLLSVAFAPDYASSGLFYVAYTNLNGAIEIAEFKRSANPLQAQRNSRRRLLAIPHSGASNHNGGQLHFFGGLLYISTGDGGNLDPPGEPARNLRSLLGKILRINPAPNGARPYTVPANNPFVGTGNRAEIFAYGLRNPWRFSFDAGNIIIADVGQSMQEEINYLPLATAKGANLGWPQYEGNRLFDDDRPGPHPPTFPLVVYAHTNGRCAVIGGYVSRDPRIPDLDGRYIFGDLCNGQIRALVADVAAQEPTSNVPVGISSRPEIP